MRVALLVLGVVVAVGALGERDAQAHPPPFWWMADTTNGRHAGFEAVIGNPDLVLSDTTTVSGSVYGHFAASPTVSIDVRLPLGFSYFDDAGLIGEDSEAALGNLSLGITGFARRRSGIRTNLTFGGGFRIYVPTASDNGASLLAAGASGQLALPDPGRWLINATTARLHGDMRVESGVFFFQGELSLDLVIIEDVEDETLVNLGIGPGVMLSPEIAMLLELSLVDIDNNEDVTTDIGLRYHNHDLMAGFRIYVPLSDPFRNNDLFGAGFDIAGRF